MIISCSNPVHKNETEKEEVKEQIDTIKELTFSYNVEIINDTSQRHVAMSHFINTTVSEYLPVLDEKKIFFISPLWIEKDILILN